MPHPTRMRSSRVSAQIVVNGGKLPGRGQRLTTGTRLPAPRAAARSGCAERRADLASILTSSSENSDCGGGGERLAWRTRRQREVLSDCVDL
ncbi:hypothetical protein MRB53_041737 [Persea americana]|nr:hypothetical protein MRB53_041737 [Persea americana]